MRKHHILFTVCLVIVIAMLFVLSAPAGTGDLNTRPADAALKQGTADVTPSYLTPLGDAQVAALLAELEAERAAWFAGIQAEADRLAAEAEAQAQAARQASPAAPAPAPSTPTVASTGGTPGECDGVDWVIPVHIVWRESRCDFGAINHTGCGGWTCVGAYQFDLRHWIPRDQGGWGGCAWLGDWREPANQIACARQMSRDGTYLAPWGG